MYRSKLSCGGRELDGYLDYLCDEIAHFAPAFEGHRFMTMQIGGGTPSILTAKQIKRLLNAIDDNFTFGQGHTRCIEIKPTLVDEKQLDTAVAHGCNRISIGVQSLNPGAMKMAGREFAPPGRLEHIVSHLNSLGVHEINADLIGGLPGDTPEGFRDSFQSIAALGVSTITVYFFRLENSNYSQSIKKKYAHYGTLDYTGKFIMAAASVAGEHGFVHITNNPYYTYQEFVRKDFIGKRLEKQHTAWNASKNNSCLGLGVGAHSFILNAVEFVNSGPHGVAHVDINAGLGFDMEFTATKYLTIISDAMEQMRDFVIKALYSQGRVSLSQFRSVFEKNIQDVFSTEITALARLDKISLHDDFLEMRCEGFERSVYLKFFYNQSDLSKLCDSAPPTSYLTF